MRVYELARKQGLSSKELLEVIRGLGIEVKSHSSSLSPEQVEAVGARLAEPSSSPAPAAPPKALPEKKPTAGEEVAAAEEPTTRKKITVKFPITVRQLAEILNEKPNVLIKSLLQGGIFASLNQFLDEANAVALAAERGFDLIPEVERPGPEPRPEPSPPPPRKKAPQARPRDPVVTLMGHIDHGKTSILDAIRRSRITSREAGGITQHIGAYRVSNPQGTVVFLDTPGHEAFTTMRSRGARVTDIVILVVAADEGIMPQTVEAIDHARAAGVPVMAAINKVDKAAADPDRVRRQLAEKGLVPESLGGETVCCEISALNRTGLDELLELILLQAEMLELKAPSSGPADGTVIEAKLTADRGPVATLLVQSGRLRRGDHLVCDGFPGKVKAMFDDRGKTLREAGPSTPVEVMGIQGVPRAGSFFRVVDSEADARRAVEEKKSAPPPPAAAAPVSLDDFLEKLSEEEKKELRLILKADVQGSLEAVRQSLEKLAVPDVSLDIIHSGVGAVTDSDIMLASASRAVVIAFNVNSPARVSAQARKEGVEIRDYKIIYKVVEDIEKALKGMLEPVVVETVTGRAEVKETFKISRRGVVAGCLVEQGKIRAGAMARVVRDDEILARDRIISLKRFKDAVREVSAGQECGIALANFNGFTAGDTIEAFETG